jgi:AcrR family transcriptional regulator
MPTPATAPDPARRSDRAHRAILEATGQLIQEQGFAATSIDQIAQRAGVGKQTIYRWWPNKAAVVLAYAQQATRRVPEPDTGSLRGDLRTLAADLCRMLGDTPGGRVCVELIGAAQVDPAFATAFRETFSSGRRATVLAALRRGQERGEVRADVDLEAATDMLYGPIWYRRLVSQAPLTKAFAHELADAVVSAVSPRAA